ncbi:MAG: SsrA-binding protein SmpB [Myxococcales bacterium FL481]|nr:MAG: SsrA-binding protein SmpB [Myxococcales bacterium FL481]
MGGTRKSKDDNPVLADNRKARFDYEFLQELEAGIALQGSEVKAIRDGRISLKEAFCQFNGDELFLLQAHIGEFAQAHARNHPPLRPRKLLLKRHELDKLSDAVQKQGCTIVPTRAYIKGRVIKVSIALVRGKKVHDKRATIKEREQKREMERARRERS